MTFAVCRRAPVFLLCLALTVVPSLNAKVSKADVRVLRGFTLIDGTGRGPARNSAMVVDAGRITWIGPASSLKSPAGAEVVDLTGRFVMPGIVDLHGHLGITVTTSRRMRRTASPLCSAWGLTGI